MMIFRMVEYSGVNKYYANLTVINTSCYFNPNGRITRCR